jgi:hypothetical protein
MLVSVADEKALEQFMNVLEILLVNRRKVEEGFTGKRRHFGVGNGVGLSETVHLIRR